MKGRLSMTTDGLLGAMIDIGWGLSGAIISFWL
jgi:hypothetical protein